MRLRLEIVFDAGALLLAKASFIGLRLVSLYLLANDFDRATFGMLALGMTVADLCRFLGDWGSDTFGLRLFSDPDAVSASRAYRVAIRARLASTCVALGSALVAVSIASPGLPVGVRLLICMTAATSLWLNLGVNWLQARQQLKAALPPIAVLGLLAIAAQVLLFWLQSSLGLRLAALVLSELLMAASVVAIATHVGHDGQFTTDALTPADLPLARWFRQTTPIALSTLLAVIYFRLDQIWVSRIAPATVLGDYALAARMIDPLMFVAVSLSSTLYARTSTVIMTGRPLMQVRPTALRMLRGMGSLAMVMAVGATAFALWGVPSLFPRYSGSTPFLCIGCLALVFRCMNLSLTAMMQAAGRYRVLMWLTLFNAASTVTFVAVGASLAGATGVAWGVALAEGLNFVIQVRLFNRIYSIASRSPAESAQP